MPIPYSMTQSPIVCLYHVRSATPFLSAMKSRRIEFPYTHTISLIRCDVDALAPFLTSAYFPKLRTVHYLSRPPQRAIPFSLPLRWMFPMVTKEQYPSLHDLSTTMMMSGRGYIDPFLMKRYVRDTMPSGLDFVLHIPGYQLVPGHQYERLMIRQLLAPVSPMSFLPHPYALPTYSMSHQDTYVQKKTEQAFYECLKQEFVVESRL